MSEPVSNMDVEDVLSSIRRLVSEEAKGDMTSRNISPNSNERPIRPEAEIGDPPETVPLRRSAQPTRQGLRRPPEPDKISFRKAANSAREDQIGVPPSNEFSAVARPIQRHEAAPNPAAQKLVLTDAFRVSEEDSRATALAKDPPDQARPNPSLRRTAAQNPEPSAASQDAPQSPPRRSTQRPKPFQFSSDDTLFERATKAMDALKKTEIETRGGPAGETAAIAEPAETPIKNYLTPDEISPVEQLVPEVERLHRVFEDPAASAKSGPAHEAHEADAVAPLPEPAEIEQPSTINFVEEKEPMLDEETLRDMISDMVRDELQGELGDRITRNVRKLVRREIQRAITSREFE